MSTDVARRRRRRPPAPTRPGRAAAQPPARSRPARCRGWTCKVSPYLYIAPFFVVFGIFGLFPLVYTAWVSLHDWDLHRRPSSRSSAWTTTPTLSPTTDFWNARRQHVQHLRALHGPAAAAGALPRQPAQPAAAGADVLADGACCCPNVTSVAAVAIVFGQLFGRDFGLVNWLLGLRRRRPDRLAGNKWPSWIAISTMVDWRWTGYNALIFLAAMQAIPRDLYEAAAIDGAGRWRQFWHDHPAAAAADDHLRRHHLHHRRPAALRRAAAVRQRRRRDRRLAAPVPDARRCTCTSTVREHCDFGYALGRRLGAVPASSCVVALVNFLLVRRIASKGRPMTRRTVDRAGRSRAAGGAPSSAAHAGQPADLRRRWSLVVAAVGRSRSTGCSSSAPRTNDAIGDDAAAAHARAATSATTSSRLLDNDDAHFVHGLVNSLIVVGASSPSRVVLFSHAGRLRLRQAALPRPQRAARCRHRAR